MRGGEVCSRWGCVHPDDAMGDVLARRRVLLESKQTPAHRKQCRSAHFATC